MPDEMISYLLRDAFASLPDPPHYELNWPDDSEGQARSIRELADMAGNKALPFPDREWAFDKLEDIARKDIRGRGLQNSARDAIREFAVAVLVGEVIRPKRGKGRSPAENQTRDRMIVRSVAWLIFDDGRTETEAIEIILEAVPRAGGGMLTADHIRRIIKKHGPIEKYRNQLSTFDSI